jgi:hypothetical protein
MNTNLSAVTQLSESELLEHFENLVARDRRNTAQLLVVIAEIDERKRWARHACPVDVRVLRGALPHVRTGDGQADLGGPDGASLPGRPRDGRTWRAAPERDAFARQASDTAELQRGVTNCSERNSGLNGL